MAKAHLIDLMMKMNRVGVVKIPQKNRTWLLEAAGWLKLKSSVAYDHILWHDLPGKII
jgi:hypothetical protein